MDAPEVLVGATFAGLGCVGGEALPFGWVHAGVGTLAGNRNTFHLTDSD